MDFKLVLIVAIAALTIKEAVASCGCKLTGADVCGCSGTVVRPAPIKRPIPSKPQKVCKMIGGIEPLLPIGDACSCDSQVVVPAIPAPVPCTKLKIDLDAPPCRYSCGDYSAVPLGFHDCYNEPAAKPVPVPADPVSLILAYELAQKAAAAVPEEKLQFGFRKKPEDGMFKKVLKNIPEERLFGVEREIVELKLPKIAAPVVEEFEESAEVDVVVPPAAFLSYSDLGYGPVKPSSPQFLKKKPAPLPLPAPPALDLDCGFVPGKIVIRDHLHFDRPKPCGCLAESIELYSSLEDSAEELAPCPCMKKRKLKKPCFF